MSNYAEIVIRIPLGSDFDELETAEEIAEFINDEYGLTGLAWDSYSLDAGSTEQLTVHWGEHTHTLDNAQPRHLGWAFHTPTPSGSRQP